MGFRDLLRFAKYKFLSYDKYAQGTVVWKVSAHVSMWGLILSFPAYLFGVRSGGQKAEEMIEKLETSVRPRLQQFSRRIHKLENSVDTEKQERVKLSKKTASKFKHLNRRLTVLELSEVNNDEKATSFSVRVTGDFLDQLARENRV